MRFDQLETAIELRQKWKLLQDFRKRAAGADFISLVTPTGVNSYKIPTHLIVKIFDLIEQDLCGQLIDIGLETGKPN